MGERKSQLSHAVLSGHGNQASTPSQASNKKDDEEGDITIISRILSRALSRHVRTGNNS
jgi:hypothetical protein